VRNGTADFSITTSYYVVELLMLAKRLHIPVEEDEVAGSKLNVVTDLLQMVVLRVYFLLGTWRTKEKYDWSRMLLGNDTRGNLVIAGGKSMV
jgi:hypothetical protein